MVTDDHRTQFVIYTIILCNVTLGCFLSKYCKLLIKYKKSAIICYTVVKNINMIYIHIYGSLTITET